MRAKENVALNRRNTPGNKQLKTQQMEGKSILFISTIREWGGSEVLWAETALSLAEKGYKICFATRYRHSSTLKRLKANGALHINISEPGFIRRILNKLILKRHPFLQAIINLKPRLVVITQAGNVDAGYYMNVCTQRAISYVTIAQLVTNILWAFIDDATINSLRNGYAKALRNYFVSPANLEMHNLMLGDQHPNAKVIMNAFTIPAESPAEFPLISDGCYQVAIVARLEMFHKGHDLLLQVLRQDKWKNRPIAFNVYGAGPHQQLLERLIMAYDIRNVIIKGRVENIAEVWQRNHLLILPSRTEGQSLALLEAMWCFRGAVVTDVGGAKEMIVDGYTGFIAPFPTETEIDAALERAWSMREQWEKIGLNAGAKIREVYKEHPITIFTREIENVYQETIK